MFNSLTKEKAIDSRRLTRHRPKGWTAARRARQAALIARWQPWRRSTGPRTEPGKARSSTNALKHGFRGRAYLRKMKEVRDILRASARTIAIARTGLRSRAVPVGAAAWAVPFHRPAVHVSLAPLLATLTRKT